MGRYFFHVIENKTQILDTHGDFCNDDEEIKDNAVGILVQMAEDELPDGDQHAFGVEVTDENGELVFSAELDFRSRWTRKDQTLAANSQESGPTGL